MFWDKKKHRYSSLSSSGTTSSSPTMESYSFDTSGSEERNNNNNHNKNENEKSTTTSKTTMATTNNSSSNGGGANANASNASASTSAATTNRRTILGTTTTTMNNRRYNNRTISMKFVRCISGFYCQDCGNNNTDDPLLSLAATAASSSSSTSAANFSPGGGAGGSGSGSATDNISPPSGLANLQTLQHSSSSSISPLVLAPMMMNKDATTTSSPTRATTTTATTTATATSSSSEKNNNSGNGNLSNNNSNNNNNFSVESIMGEYMALCQFYKIPYNAGVLSTLRFSLPCLRVTGSFHDMDMLAVTELLLHHANTTLRYISRLDFSIASKEGRQFRSIKVGFTSHGALALAKLLQTTKYIRQVWLPRHRIGPYGGSAIFLACQENPTIQTLNMRRCRIGERGAFAFVESMSATKVRGLIDVDLSSNGIGHRGTVAIQKLQDQQNNNSKYPNTQPLFINLEGNLVFPEIMNAITHCVGVLLSILASFLLSDRVKGLGPTHTISCAIYSTSLLVLYISSTLYHSFFPLQNTKYIFQVFDKCAIYVLIAGSYTPFLLILLGDKPIWSVGLLGFIWFCGLTGIGVEAFYPTWKYRSYFSLAMYLGMGWACLVCLPTLKDRLDQGCINLLVLGGVGYTSGVPFFVRNNNLDHAIWHLFVLSGSIFHWMALYIYVAPFPLDHFFDDTM